MTSSFFTDFLFLTDVKTIIFILILLALFYVMKQFERKKISFSTRMLSATGIGLVLGLAIQVVGGFPEDPLALPFINEINKWYGLVAYGFMDLLRMLVVPLVLVSIIRVILNMGTEDNIGKMTGRTIGILLGTTALAAIVGIITANVFGLGVGTVVEQGEVALKEVGSIVDTVRGLIPANAFEAMVSANIVGVVIFAVFLGTATRRQRKKYEEVVKPFIDLVEAFYKIMLSVAMTINKWMPYAVIALLANTIASRGLEAIYQVLDFIVAMYVAMGVMFIIHLILVALAGYNPLVYVKNVLDALILAFTSRSSLGTLPVTIENLTDNVGLDNGVSTFVASLGANGGMNGCAGIYPAMVAVMLANMSGTPLDASFYVMLVIVIALGSLGIAGLPGTATMAVSVVISGVGLGGFFPLAAGVIAIDPLIDMGRTLLNVNGTMTTAVLVGKSFNKIDKDIYYKKTK